MKTLYLWDQAWTLVDMTWDSERSGFADYDAFVQFASDGLSETDPFIYEQLYELTFTELWHRTKPLPGSLAAVALPGEHWVFTTGLPEQWIWILDSLTDRTAASAFANAISQNRSTFEFAYSNVKTAPMFRALFREAIDAGFNRVVAVDDKPQYLEQAKLATADVPQLAVELIHVATHPAGYDTPAGIRRIDSLDELVTLEAASRVSR